MSILPDQREQIITAHAAFIRQVVSSSRNPELRAELDELLRTAEQQGWGALVAAIRRIIAGEREIAVIARLDAEDRVIAEAILRGMQDPATLPDPRAKPDAALAAPGLAHMIHVASGDPQALVLLSNMAEQMSRAGGEMARLAGIIRPLINGERDPDKLCAGMSKATEQMVLGILEELAKLRAH